MNPNEPLDLAAIRTLCGKLESGPATGIGFARNEIDLAG